MSKNKSKFWFGLVLGGLGGAWATREFLEPTKMPNAKLWQRILSERKGQVEAGLLMAQVQQRYKELKAIRPSFSNWMFNFHVVRGILPGLALYQTFREMGMNQEEALSEVNWIFKYWFDQFPSMNLRLSQLMSYTPENFNIFRRLVSFVMNKFFPAPGWRYELLDDHESHFAFNMHRCFYIEVLKYYKATELTPAFCKLDDYLMATIPPSFQWNRTQTIGMGAESCDFHWDFIPAERVESG